MYSFSRSLKYLFKIKYGFLNEKSPCTKPIQQLKPLDGRSLFSAEGLSEVSCLKYSKIIAGGVEPENFPR